MQTSHGPLLPAGSAFQHNDCEVQLIFFGLPRYSALMVTAPLAAYFLASELVRLCSFAIPTDLLTLYLPTDLLPHISCVLIFTLQLFASFSENTRLTCSGAFAVLVVNCVIGAYVYQAYVAEEAEIAADSNSNNSPQPPTQNRKSD